MEVNTNKSKVVIISGKEEKEERRGITSKGGFHIWIFGKHNGENGKIDLEEASKAKEGTVMYNVLNKTIYGETEIINNIKRKVCNIVIIPCILFACEN